jgi:cysteine desulfurase
VRIYLDHNATTPLDPRVTAAMQAAFEAWGNPSSVHAEGRRARDLVERARAEVAALVGGAVGMIVFTSGGTESDVLGIVGAARAARAKGRPARLVTSPLEHPAVQGAAARLAEDGFAVARVAVDAAGRIDPASLEAGGEAAVASFALANHELGNVYDVAALARAARRGGAIVHCDAVQAAGKVAIDADALGVDLVSLSAHKIGGPKGAGALWVRRGIDLEPLHAGGHQERGLRAGTEDVAGIVGFGEAARLARAEGVARSAAVGALRDRLEAACLSIDGARVHGDRAARVGNTSNVAFAGAKGELVVIALDLEGVAASTGAACTSGRVEPSPVIVALGEPRPRAAEAVRFSLGPSTTAEEIDRVAALLPAIVSRIRSAGPA